MRGIRKSKVMMAKRLQTIGFNFFGKEITHYRPKVGENGQNELLSNILVKSCLKITDVRAIVFKL